jgi:hypothetical protein
MCANEIRAAYIQMRNSGQNCVGRLGSEPRYITIEEWRDQELKKLGDDPGV